MGKNDSESDSYRKVNQISVVVAKNQEADRRKAIDTKQTERKHGRLSQGTVHILNPVLKAGRIAWWVAEVTRVVLLVQVQAKGNEGEMKREAKCI